MVYVRLPPQTGHENTKAHLMSREVGSPPRADSPSFKVEVLPGQYGITADKVTTTMLLSWHHVSTILPIVAVQPATMT